MCLVSTVALFSTKSDAKAEDINIVVSVENSVTDIQSVVYEGKKCAYTNENMTFSICGGTIVSANIKLNIIPEVFVTSGHEVLFRSA